MQIKIIVTEFIPPECKETLHIESLMDQNEFRALASDPKLITDHIHALCQRLEDEMRKRFQTDNA